MQESLVKLPETASIANSTIQLATMVIKMAEYDNLVLSKRKNQPTEQIIQLIDEAKLDPRFKLLTEGARTKFDHFAEFEMLVNGHAVGTLVMFADELLVDPQVTGLLREPATSLDHAFVVLEQILRDLNSVSCKKLYHFNKVKKNER